MSEVNIQELIDNLDNLVASDLKLVADSLQVEYTNKPETLLAVKAKLSETVSDETVSETVSETVEQAEEVNEQVVETVEAKLNKDGLEPGKPVDFNEANKIKMAKFNAKMKAINESKKKLSIKKI